MSLEGGDYLAFQFREVKRFDDIVIRGNGFYILLEGVIGRAKNDGQTVILVPDFLQEIQPVIVNHLDIKDHQVRFFVLNFF